MVCYAGMSGIGTQISGFVARHPRLVATLLALTLLLTIQDGAMAADGTLTDSMSEGSVDLGPNSDDG